MQFAGFIAVIVAVNLLTACARDADPGQSPDKSAKHLAVYKNSQLPAAQLMVKTVQNNGSRAVTSTDSEGGFRLPSETFFLEIRDPTSGLSLYKGAPSTSHKLSLPRPIRVSGQLRNFGGFDSTDVHAGGGRMQSALEFHGREYDVPLGTVVENQSPNFVPLVYDYDLLPRIATEWHVFQPDFDQSFVSGWLIVNESIQLIVAGSSGEVAVLQAEVPDNINAGDTLDVGTIEPNSSSLDISIDPAVINEDFMLDLILENPEALLRSSPGNALHAVLLSRIDIQLSLFLTGRGSLSTQGKSSLRIQGLPNADDVALVFQSDRPGVRHIAAVDFEPGKPAMVALDATAALGADNALTVINGTLLFADGEPAAGAEIEYISVPFRETVIADDSGRFRIDKARVNRPARLYITARNQIDADAISIIEDIDWAMMPDVDANLHYELPIPGLATESTPLHNANELFGKLKAPCDNPQNWTQSRQFFGGKGGKGYEAVLGIYYNVKGSIEYIIADLDEYFGSLYTIELRDFKTKGSVVLERRPKDAARDPFLIAKAQYSPFLFASSFPRSVKVRHVFPIDLSIEASSDVAASTVIKVVDAGKKPIADQTVYFPAVIDGLDPYTEVTDDNGQITIACMNTHAQLGGLPMYVEADIDGDIQIFDGACYAKVPTFFGPNTISIQLQDGGDGRCL